MTTVLGRLLSGALHWLQENNRISLTQIGERANGTWQDLGLLFWTSLTHIPLRFQSTADALPSNQAALCAQSGS